MHIVFDFDGTLFRTGCLWNTWLDRLEECGLDRDEVTDLGEKLFSTGFTPREHARQAGLDGIELDDIVSEFEQWVEEEGERLVFDDVRQFIVENQEKHTFCILTFGDPDFQHFKIEASGLGDLIDEIHIARPERKKYIQLKEFLDEFPEILFIDDNPQELESVRDAGIPIRLARMIREDSRHTAGHPEDNKSWQAVTGLKDIDF